MINLCETGAAQASWIPTRAITLITSRHLKLTLRQLDLAKQPPIADFLQEKKNPNTATI